MKNKGLGRGLDAIFGLDGANIDVKSTPMSSMREIEITKIIPNPTQPRSKFDDEAMEELVDSIRTLGVIQPITVKRNTDNEYVIISGERRWRASQIVGLENLPAYIREADDENLHAMALVENIQRQDLTALEIALAYQHLLEQYGMTQEQLSERVGKNRATVTNYLRLLKLPAPIQMGLKNREIEMGHARALLALDDPEAQIKLFNEIKKEKMSVRKIEEMAKELSEGGTVRSGGQRIRQKGSTLNAEYNVLKDSLSKFFQTKVQLTCSDKGKGKITIPFSNEQELERIIELFDQLNH